jgi:hypothetical protein
MQTRQFANLKRRAEGEATGGGRAALTEPTPADEPPSAGGENL